MSVPDFTIIRNGEEVEITDISVGPAEPDVGIMSVYVDSYTAMFNGVDITEDLTVEEDTEITKKILDYYYGDSDELSSDLDA